MYTQCPDCEIAFKVTADVLKQAAGMVRCGSCGHAFNALAYLSEQMPEQPKYQSAGSARPELKAEIIDTDDGLPQSISAEQSAALLKTLDELAGSNIRIEDTGVEWRVLDEEDAAAPAADDDDAGDNYVAAFALVDVFLEVAATAIDEFLTATPEVVDAPEIFAATADEIHEALDELRFDDNTPLPEDFDIESAASDVSTPKPGPEVGADNDIEEDSPKKDEPADFALSEPDEWTDILGEFEDVSAELSDPPETSADSVSTEDAEPDAEPVPDDAIAATNPPTARESDSRNELPLDMDAQFALQAEAMGIEFSGIDVIEADEEPDDEFSLTLDVDLDDKLEDEFEIELENTLDRDLDDDQPDFELDDDLDSADEERDADFDDEIEQLDLIVEQDEYTEEPVVARHSIEDELAAAAPESEAEAEAESETQSAISADAFHLPPMTEEEHTVNMMIDQDLMSFATEDEDGFASTIVMADKNAEKMARTEKAEVAAFDIGDEDDDPDEAQGFETIIMEGDFVRSAVDAEKYEEDAAAAAILSEIARESGQEEVDRPGRSRIRFGMVAGLVLLVLVLTVQAIHQSREALATMPGFSSTVGQIYRALGKPIQPAWDITGWRFEATKGNAEGEQGELTIYSRLGNKSDSPLPYPLIAISLTDRFEETIGSRILDPAEYLPTDLDPRKLVPPGNTFNAVITIDSTTENATGFKLNVCYRWSDGELRCAIDDFK